MNNLLIYNNLTRTSAFCVKTLITCVLQLYLGAYMDTHLSFFEDDNFFCGKPN